MSPHRKNKRAALGIVSLAAALATFPTHAADTHSDAHWATINGHRMYYEMRGSGRPLLLLHGGGDSGSHSFERQVDLFARTHRIVLPDQVGQGHTPDVPGPLSYAGMLQDTVDLLHTLQLRRLDVVGFSDGGILALMLAVRHPELVRRVVISGVNVQPEGLNANELDDLRAAAPPTPPATIDDKLRQLWLHSPTPQELSFRDLGKIRSPVLVMSGDRDAVSLEHTLKIYRAIPHADLCILPDTYHETFALRPKWVNPIALDFLDRR